MLGSAAHAADHGLGMIPGRLARALEHPRSRWVAVVAALVLSAPSLSNGLVLDDHLQELALTNEVGGLARGPTDLFSFSPDEESRRSIMAVGLAPWWSPPGIRLSLMRPLSSLTHALDYTLWPGSAVLMHLHSLGWLAALILAVSFLYDRILPRPAAALATWMFAMDDAHALPAGWVANRNALITSVFVVLALLAHDAWRRNGERSGAWVSALALGAGLMAGEMAISFGAFLIAYTLFLDQTPWRSRLLAVVPSAIVVTLWRFAYSALGYGIAGSDVYRDPVTDPLAFGAALVERGPLLLSSQLGGLPSDLSAFAEPAVARTLWWTACAGLLVIMLVATPVLRGDRVARFSVVATILCVVPACATFANDRLLVLAGVGGMALTARLIERVPRRGPPTLLVRLHPLERRLGAILAGLWLVTHLVISPVSLALRSLTPAVAGDMVSVAARDLPRDLAGKTVVVASSPAALYCSHLIVARAGQGLSVPEYLRCLWTSEGAVVLLREDENTLLVQPERSFLDAPLGGLFRSRSQPMRVGERVNVPGMAVTVLDVDADGMPAVFRVRFEVPLEDPRLVWVVYRAGRCLPITPPAIGRSLTIPASRLTDAIEWAANRKVDQVLGRH